MAQDVIEIPTSNATIKIDGKLLEFSDSLVNYDKTTKLNYAFTHDQNNLYVFLKANKQMEGNKIMAGGVSVSVNATGKKKAVSAITFPIVDRTAMMAEMRNRGNRNSENTTQKTPEERAKERTEIRQKTLTGLKEIKVTGFSDITVESISIYNTYGIKTGINYNDKNALIYELAVPLKLVGLDAANANEFAINIKLNGIEMPEMGGGGGGFGGGMGGDGVRSSSGGSGNFGGGARTGAQGGSDYMSLFSPTDFWVKAKLVK
ncbi:hypothetical protein A5893_16675 [Pedobacter psychrophilus]|uniref:Uncharacterized protein n=2 Tax=Pedobacter psychrophilus TaxID=1826909 RepID=A0A179DB51_9SPHI|nr:hypothetical protein A5893_16675 [Pedobacter psychrophilus]